MFSASVSIAWGIAWFAVNCLRLTLWECSRFDYTFGLVPSRPCHKSNIYGRFDKIVCIQGGIEMFLIRNGEFYLDVEFARAIT